LAKIAGCVNAIGKRAGDGLREIDDSVAENSGDYTHGGKVFSMRRICRHPAQKTTGAWRLDSDVQAGMAALHTARLAPR